MALNLNKDGGEIKKFNLSKTSDGLPNISDETNNSNTSDSSPKKSNKIIWFIIGAIVIVGGIWFVTNKSTDTTLPSNIENNQAGSIKNADSSHTGTPSLDTSNNTISSTTANNTSVDNSKKDITSSNVLTNTVKSNEKGKQEVSTPIVTKNNNFNEKSKTCNRRFKKSI